MSALSDRLMQVTKGMTITVRYFKEDTAHPEVPAVGNYITLTGKADRIDPVFRTLQRNYLQVGMYTEMIFPQKGVRFIATLYLDN